MNKVIGASLRRYGKGLRAIVRMSDGDRTSQKTKALGEVGKREAERLLRKWAVEIDGEPSEPCSSVAAGPSSPEVASYVGAYIDEMEATKTVEAATVKTYRMTFKFIEREWADTPLSQVTAERARSWEASLSEAGYSQSLVGKCHRLLKQVLTRAVDDGLIGANPMAPMRGPRRENIRRGINAMAAPERARLLDAIASMADTPATVAARIALWTGMREGEVCALRWADVDWDARAIWARRSVNFGKGGCYLKVSKTGKTRDVAMPRELVGLLSGWHTQQGCPAGTAYVLTGTGGFRSPQTLRRQWATLSAALGLVGTEGRRVIFHDLRHTGATMAVAAGIDIKMMASNLGHAKAAMTLSAYASADPDAKRRAAEVIRRAMRETPPR